MQNVGFVNHKSVNKLHTSAQRRPQKFFQGGGGASDLSIIYRIQYNLTAATRILVRSLEPKVKIILLKKCCDRAACWTNWCNSSVLFTGVWGQSPQSLGNFRNFLKKIPFYRHLDHISNGFRPLERTKLLRLGIFLKFWNCPPFQSSLFPDQIQTTFKRSHDYVSQVFQVTWIRRRGG